MRKTIVMAVQILGLCLLIVQFFVPSAEAAGISLAAITVADVVTEYGKYYRPEGQGVQDIIDMFYEQSETEAVLRMRPTDQTELRRSSAELTSVLQAFQKKYTPKGGVTFKPRTIPMYKLKIDIAEYPDDLEESWLGFLASEKLDRKQWPFVRWFVEKHVLPKSKEDFELNEIYSGVYEAPAEGVAGADGKSMNGIKKWINDGIADGSISPIITGPLEVAAADFVDQVEEFVKDIDKKMVGKIKSLQMSRSNMIKFREGMRAKYNVNYSQVGDLLQVIDYGIVVKGLPSMEGSDKLWCTIPENAVLGVKKPTNPNIMQIENVDRQVKAYTDFWKGVGFWINQWVYTNDVETSEASS